MFAPVGTTRGCYIGRPWRFLDETIGDRQVSRGVLDGRLLAGNTTWPAGRKRQLQLRLVRHLPSRASDGVSSLRAGRCCISLEGGNRGERRSGCLTQLLWRLRWDDAVISLRATPRQDRADDCRRFDALGCDAVVCSHDALRRRAQQAHEAIHRTPESTSS
jgi:hypothetical protein